MHFGYTHGQGQLHHVWYDFDAQMAGCIASQVLLTLRRKMLSCWGVGYACGARRPLVPLGFNLLGFCVVCNSAPVHIMSSLKRGA